MLIVDENIQLIGKLVRYMDETYRIIDIFPCPTVPVQRAFFAETYRTNYWDSQKALSPFLGQRDLEVCLYCQNEANGKYVIIPFTEVELL